MAEAETSTEEDTEVTNIEETITDANKEDFNIIHMATTTQTLNKRCKTTCKYTPNNSNHKDKEEDTI